MTLTYAQWSRDYRREQLRRDAARAAIAEVEAMLVAALPQAQARDVVEIARRITDKHRPLASTYDDCLADREDWT